MRSRYARVTTLRVATRTCEGKHSKKNGMTGAGQEPKRLLRRE